MQKAQRLLHVRAFCSQTPSDPFTKPGLYAWGRALTGQFGKGKHKITMEDFTQVDYPQIPHSLSLLKKIHALEENTIFQFEIDGEDILYGVGLGSYGNAGFISQDPEYVPIPFPYKCADIFQSKLKSITYGRFHTLFLTGK
jgi:alpha-tubulin suppressor-like RCC1 family protein